MMCAHSPPLAADAPAGQHTGFPVAPGIIYAVVAIVFVWQTAIAPGRYQREALARPRPPALRAIALALSPLRRR